MAMMLREDRGLLGSAPFCSDTEGGSRGPQTLPGRDCRRRSPTSASPAASGAHGTLIVFGAGTLATPFAAEIAAFKKANPGVTVHSQFAASGDRVKAITRLHQPADVLGVADYSLIPKLMFTANATWYLGFVSNQITFAYTSRS